MLPTHDVPCPGCGKALYSAVSLEDAVDAGAIESPKVEHDLQGDYMRCPHCGKRVPMARMTVGNAEAWRPVKAPS
jgi:DNA-directed RNA polymerase subunit RPC12/RpoP